VRDCHELPSRIKRHRKKKRSEVAENIAAISDGLSKSGSQFRPEVTLSNAKGRRKSMRNS
jgi:hypothetical protein